jgi:diguanylate cyclase (GGDEF)-like protein/PAS domain S-box-containing protein
MLLVDTKHSMFSRAHRIEMKLPVWTPLAAALAVIAIGVLLVVRWQGQGERAQGERLKLTQISVKANQMSTLEWQAIASRDASSELAAETAATLARIRSLLADLRRTDPGDTLIQHDVPDALTEYGSAVQLEFALLEGGQVRRAQIVDSSTVDPGFKTLSGTLAAADAEHERDAVSARSHARIGSAATLALGLLIISLLLWRFIRAQQRATAAQARADGVRRSEREFRALARNASDLVTVIDPDLLIRYQSDSIERILGLPVSAVVGKRITELIHPDDVQVLTSALPLARRPAGDSQTRVESRMRNSDGHWTEVEMIVARMARDDEDDDRLVLTSREIGERKALEEQLRQQALHDALTGLPNRALLEDRVEHALVAARRTDARVAVIFADLDAFKLVNDSLGHAAGDDLLRMVAQRLRDCIRDADTVARLGGDEFAILLGSSDAGAAEVMAKRVLESLSAPLSLMGRQMTPRISLGIAVSDADASDTQTLMRNADIAMYAAKRRGQGGFARFEPSMSISPARDFEMAEELDRALDEGQFELNYQPIFDLESGEIAGVEALVRWNHPREGVLGPLEFIPLAEQTGAIVPIGRWVLQEACRQVGTWNHKRTSSAPLHVCVNLSTRQLDDPQLVCDVRSALEAGQLLPGQLVLELTESLLIDDVESTRLRLEELKAVGVRLAVDDFGTGYSALSYLQRFPLDILKIDRSFIKGLQRGNDQSNIVEALIQLGAALDLEIVAEGIEQPDQLTELRRMRSNYGQGFLFARPLTADAVTALLSEKQADAPQPTVAAHT